MNKNICLLYFDHMSGEFTSILDTYNNIKKYFPFEILVISEKNKELPILRRYLPSEIPITFFNLIEKTECYNTVICSAFYFFNLAQQKIKNFFSCDNLIILDSSSFIMSWIHGIPIFDEIKNFPAKNKYVLGNKFNKKFFQDDITYLQYYHKFDFSRLDKYKEIKRNEFFTKKKFYHPLEYMGMDYYRQIKVNFREPFIQYYENIGKLIFEMLYLERIVHYSPKNKSFAEDGLTDYLSLFNINDTQEQDIYISKNQIIKNLGFTRNDLILEIIGV